MILHFDSSLISALLDTPLLEDETMEILQIGRTTYATLVEIESLPKTHLLRGYDHEAASIHCGWDVCEVTLYNTFRAVGFGTITAKKHADSSLDEFASLLDSNVDVDKLRCETVDLFVDVLSDGSSTTEIVLKAIDTRILAARCFDVLKNAVTILHQYFENHVPMQWMVPLNVPWKADHPQFFRNRSLASPATFDVGLMRTPYAAPQPHAPL